MQTSKNTIPQILAATAKCAYCEGKLDPGTLVCVRRDGWQDQCEAKGGATMWGMCLGCFKSKRKDGWKDLRKLYRGTADICEAVVAEVGQDPPHP